MEENEKNRRFKVFIVLLIAIIVFAVVISTVWFGTAGIGMMGGMMGFGWPFIFVPIIVIIVFIYALLDRDSISYYEGGNPMQILERRYANGEITRDEYLKMKDDLNRNNPVEM